MGKTYRKGAYTNGKKVLEGSGGIVKQKKNPVSTEKYLKVKTVGKKSTLVVQDLYKGDEDLKQFIHYLNSIETSIEIVSEYVKPFYKLIFAYRIDSPTEYEGNINYNWFTHQLGYPITVDKKHIVDKAYIQSHKKILLKDEYVYCEVDHIKEAEIIEEPVVLWSGSNKESDDINRRLQREKRKEELRTEENMEDYLKLKAYFGSLVNIN